MDVSSVQNHAQATAAAAHDQSRANMLLQKVLRNPNPSEADRNEAMVAARDRDTGAAAQRAALAAAVGKGTNIDTHA